MKSSRACCGKDCSACEKFIQQKCMGCREDEQNDSCPVRDCCWDTGVFSCRECPNKCWLKKTSCKANAFGGKLKIERILRYG